MEVQRYRTPEGRVPLDEWLETLRDPRARAKLQVRFRRLSIGHFGDAKAVGEGVLELREDTGPGYRVYFGLHGTQLVLLICGGDKSSQRVDIQKAKRFWRDWKESHS